jgi:hypothetical protein
MSISADATGTPIPKPNGTFAFVDLQTGALSEHGLQMFQRLYDFVVGMNRLTPCNATGTNLITLTPLDSSPMIEKYVDYEVFTFVAAANSTNTVTATVVPKKGALDTLKVFKTDGSAQAASGDVVEGNLYLAIYNDALDLGNGGFVLK